MTPKETDSLELEGTREKVKQGAVKRIDQAFSAKRAPWRENAGGVGSATGNAEETQARRKEGRTSQGMEGA